MSPTTNIYQILNDVNFLVSINLIARPTAVAFVSGISVFQVVNKTQQTKRKSRM